jgi:hypothetical protein
MENPYLYDTGSATPEWRTPRTLFIASELRELRNTAIHNKSESMNKLEEVVKSWAN